jgi:pyruvate dehydrogenase E1 component beta subunit
MTGDVKIVLREALRDALAEEMRADKNVFIMGEEVGEYQGAYKVTQGLLAEFGPERVIDTPITEHGFTGLAVGAAFTGLKPVVEFMTFNFAMQAIDQIINSAAKTNYMSGGFVQCSIVFRGPNGSAARVGAQHSQCYASWYAHCPGLKVIAPYTVKDHKALLKAAIADPNPVIFLESELLYGDSEIVGDDFEEPVEIGKAKVVKQGTKCTLVGFSYIMKFVLQAATELEAEGIDVEVIDLRTIQPLDIETVIESVKKTNHIVCVEEGWGFAGIASEINTQVVERAFDHLDHQPLRVTAEFVPLPYAENLERECLPTVAKIKSAIHTALGLLENQSE